MKRFFTLPAFVALAACSGAMAASPTICNGPAIPSFTMTNPTAGSSGVADSIPELIFAGTLYSSQYAPPSITVRAAGGFSYTSTTFSRITSIDTPGSYYGVKLPALSAKTTYSVTYTIEQAPSDTACGGPMNLTEGSFTTQ